VRDKEDGGDEGEEVVGGVGSIGGGGRIPIDLDDGVLTATDEVGMSCASNWPLKCKGFTGGGTCRYWTAP